MNAMTISGMIQINAASYDFVLNITEPVLQTEYERVKATGNKFRTKSILETFSFKKFTLLVILSDENKIIESPHKQLLRRLADSWLVDIVDALADRFVKPHISKQSQFFLERYKRSLTDDMCSSLKKQEFMNEEIAPSFQDSRTYGTHSYGEINLKNLKRFANCDGNSVSLKLTEKSDCNEGSYLLHYIILAFTYPKTYSEYETTLGCTYTYTESSTDRYHNYHNTNKPPTTKKHTASIKYVTVDLAFLSMKNGNQTKLNNIEVNIQLQNSENTDEDSSQTECKKKMENKLEEQIKSLLIL